MVIGIDPGMQGGVAVSYKSGKTVLHKMPATIADMQHLFYSIRHNEDGAISEDAVVYIEELTGYV